MGRPVLDPAVVGPALDPAKGRPALTRWWEDLPLTRWWEDLPLPLRQCWCARCQDYSGRSDE
jgi:hypothetical protein